MELGSRRACIEDSLHSGRGLGGDDIGVGVGIVWVGDSVDRKQTEEGIGFGESLRWGLEAQEFSCNSASRVGGGCFWSWSWRVVGRRHHGLELGDKVENKILVVPDPDITVLLGAGLEVGE